MNTPAKRTYIAIAIVNDGKAEKVVGVYSESRFAEMKVSDKQDDGLVAFVRVEMLPEVENRVEYNGKTYWMNAGC